MFNYRDFTTDPYRYNNLPAFVDGLHERNMKYVPIIDAGIAVRPWTHYPAYDSGVEQKVFMRINDGQTFIGQVWPNDAAYPDFFNTNANNWWSNELDLFNQNVKVDGIWLDMNEASNFCSGVCYKD
jgi:alpha-glucosidase (family GH31 glycosyl hydrolase)